MGKFRNLWNRRLTRSKLIFGILIVAIPAILLWTAIKRDAVMRQFSLDRNSLESNAEDATIFPSQIGDFKRHTFTTTTSKYSDRWGYANYEDSQGRGIDLSVQFRPAPKFVLASILSMICGDVSGTATQSLNSFMPFSYGTCSAGSFSQYSFTWVNGDWLIAVTAASTMLSDSTTLIHFVNSYSY